MLCSLHGGFLIIISCYKLYDFVDLFIQKLLKGNDDINHLKQKFMIDFVCKQQLHIYKQNALTT